MAIDFEVRELKDIDLEDPADFFKTLSNLRDVGNVSPEFAKQILLKMNCQGCHVFVAVTPKGKIIGSATLLVEQKFIRNCGRCGHVEDVSVDEDYEGNGVGSAVVKKCIEFAKKFGCYKVILDSADENIPFYEKIGFKKHETCMRIDL